MLGQKLSLLAVKQRAGRNKSRWRYKVWSSRSPEFGEHAGEDFGEAISNALVQLLVSSICRIGNNGGIRSSEKLRENRGEVERTAKRKRKIGLRALAVWSVVRLRSARLVSVYLMF